MDPVNGRHSPARVNPIFQHEEERRLSMDGQWLFKLDPDDIGIGEKWFEPGTGFQEKIMVPGSWQGQGFGGSDTEKVWDFGLQARVLRATYQGTGWYGKSFRIPEEWYGARLWINFGGIHPSGDIWVNGNPAGKNSAPFVPFSLDITDLVDVKEDNYVSVRVHEKDRSLGFAMNWQGRWSGLYRSVEITATGPAWIKSCLLKPEISAGSINLDLSLGGSLPGDASARIRLIDSNRSVVVEEEFNNVQLRNAWKLRVPGISPWSPEKPVLYRFDLSINSNDRKLDALSERIGFMDISASGKRISIGGIPYFLRGTGDFVINPETGCPDTDRNRWRKKLKKLKDYGYNYVRCQSYAPTPEYLDMADEIGLIVQSEMGVLGAWAGNSVWHGYAWPQPTPAFRGKLMDQWRRVMMRDVNHPSAAIYCMSNELGDGTLFPRTAWQCYNDTKKIKPGSLVIWTDGGHNRDLPADFVKGEASLVGKADKPVIQHEYRWWSTYPDIRIKQNYSSTAMRPIAIEMAEERAEKWGLGHLLPVMARNSQKLQYCEAKNKMEALRRDNPELAGVCHFTAMDVGFTPQGILDEFYGRKHATPDEWRRCWDDTVLMIDKGFEDRVLVGGETLSFDLYISDFSRPPLDSPDFKWWLEIGGKVFEKEGFVSRHQPFRTHKVCRIEVELPERMEPENLVLHAQASDGVRSFRNEWNFTLFPREKTYLNSVALYRGGDTWASGIDLLPRISSEDLGEEQDPSTIISGVVDDKLMDFLSRGGRVVLAAGEGIVKPFTAKLGLKEGRYYFLPPANYPPLGDGNSGTIISPHPITDELPHEGWADLKFYRLIKDSPPIDLAALGVPKAETIIRSLSTYFTCRPMAYLVEFRVGKGGMIFCALDLDQTLPEARYLLSKIVQYSNGAEFSPPNTMGVEKLKRIASLMPPIGSD